MSNPPGFDWYTSDIWPNTHNRTAGAFQNVPDPINNPSDFAFASIDPLLLDHAATLPPELLNPGYTGPAADSGSYLGSLDWLADETTFGQTSSGRYGTAGLRPRNLDHHPSLHIPPIGPNNGPSSQVPHTPMAGPSGSSRGRTVSPRERRSDVATNTGPVKCEWKGCTYSGVFSRRIELKRHVETKHIFPRSYECPEPGCKKLFNRGDNLREHSHRIH